jgi:hypothetical protein
MELEVLTLDAEKAFDTFNHDIMFSKLYQDGVEGDTISSAHAEEATPMSQNVAPSVLIVRLLRIVLLYLLYKRVDSFALAEFLVLC